jgi:hypothetical protein
VPDWPPKTYDSNVTTCGNVTVVGKIHRGGFILVRWIGDHSPRHVHVYRDGKLIVKWDLEHGQPMRGKASARLRRILKELVEEGEL